MRRFLILGVLAFPTMALPQSDTQDGIGLIERGLGIIADNLWTEFGPQLDLLGRNMGGALSDLGPVVQDLAALVDDLGNYQRPERLENGDILIRRKPGAPPPPPLGESLRAPDDDNPGQSPVPIDPNQMEIPL